MNIKKRIVLALQIFSLIQIFYAQSLVHHYNGLVEERDDEYFERINGT